MKKGGVKGRPNSFRRRREKGLLDCMGGDKPTSHLVNYFGKEKGRKPVLWGVGRGGTGKEFWAFWGKGRRKNFSHLFF